MSDPILEPPAARSLGPDTARSSLDQLAQASNQTTQAVGALGSSVKSTLQFLQGVRGGATGTGNGGNWNSPKGYSGQNNGGSPTINGQSIITGGGGPGGTLGSGLPNGGAPPPSNPYTKGGAYLGAGIGSINSVAGVNSGTLNNWANMRTQFGGMSNDQIRSVSGLGSAGASSMSSLFGRTGWGVGSTGGNRLMQSAAGSSILTGVSAVQSATSTASMFSAQSANLLRMMGLGNINSMRLSGQNPVTSIANQLIQKSNAKAQGNKLTPSSVTWLAYASDSPIVQNLHVMVMQGAIDPSTVEQIQGEVYNQLMTFAKSGMSFSKYSSLEKRAAGTGSSARSAQNTLYKSGATVVGKADLLNQQQAASMEGRQIGATGGYLAGLSSSAVLIGKFNDAMSSLLNGPLGAALGYTLGFSEAGKTVTTLGVGVSKVVKGATLLAGKTGGAGFSGWGGYSEASSVSGALSTDVSGSSVTIGTTGASSSLGGSMQYGGSYGAGTGRIPPTSSSLSPTATAPANSSATQKNIIAIARKYLGVPYLWGGTDPKKGLDCSGFTQLVFSQVGIRLPRVSSDQARTGAPVSSLREAQPGDLIAFGSPVHHVAIYMGNNMVINAPHTGTNVRIESISNFDGIAAIRRLVPGATSSSAGRGVSRQGAASVPTSGGSVANNKVIVQSQAQTMGWGTGAEWDALNNLIMSESGYRNTAQNPTSTAYGMFQFLDNTWAGYGTQKTSDPFQQTLAGLRYIQKRYGDPIKAWNFHKSKGWYDKGAWNLKEDEDARVHKGEMIIPAEPAEKLREKFDQMAEGKTAAIPGGKRVVLNFEPGSISLAVGAGATPGQGRALAHEFAYTLATDARIKAMMDGTN